MTDDTQQTPVAPNGLPVLPDPQKVVDEVLSVPQTPSSPTSDPTPVEAIPPELSPAPQPTPETVPPELVGAPSEPAPLSAPEEPKPIVDPTPAEPATPLSPTQPLTSPTVAEIPSEQSPTVSDAMTPNTPPTPQPTPALPATEEPPLAFATPTSTTTLTVSSPAFPPEPPLAASSTPPVPPSPLVGSQKGKKKGKGKKVLLTIVGVLFFMVGLVGVGGLYYYSQAKTGSIAVVLIDGAFRAVGGTIVNNNTGGTVGTHTVPTRGGGTTNVNTSGGSTSGSGSQGNTSGNTSSTYSGTGIATSNVAGGFGYNYDTGQPASQSDWNSSTANIAGTYISNGKRYLVQNPDTANAAALYNATTHNITNSQPGAVAPSIVATMPTQTPEEIAAMIAKGFTFVPGGIGCNDMPSRTNNGSDGYNGGSGPESGPVDCNIPHWTTCAAGTTGVQGVGCVTNTTKTTTTTTTNSSTPTLACSSLTKNTADADITIGKTLTLTCAGATTPADVATISYNFRYSIDTGSWTTLTNKTATTAELTVAKAGTYSVECQACATINGTKTCDPNWQGATTP